MRGRSCSWGQENVGVGWDGVSREGSSDSPNPGQDSTSQDWTWRGGLSLSRGEAAEVERVRISLREGLINPEVGSGEECEWF